MTVGELIKKLKSIDKDRLVVCASDSEGNDYSPLRTIWAASYAADCRSVGLETLTAADRKAGYTEEDVLELGVPALVLSP
jgi:hypothetical protein